MGYLSGLGGGNGGGGEVMVLQVGGGVGEKEGGKGGCLFDLV